MKKNKLLLSLMMLILLSPSVTYADVKVNGKFTLTYEPEVFSSKPSDAEKEKAISKAKLSAWEKYTQSFSTSKMKSYRKIESSILNNIDLYIIESTIIHEKVNEDSKKYSVILRATINASKFDAKLSEVSNAGSMRSGSGSLFSFVFVARAESSIKSFNSKKTSIEMNEGKGFENESASVNNGASLSSHDYKNIKKKTTGGSTVNKSDDIKYKILSSDGIDTSINQELTAAGFEVVDYGDVVSECGGTEPAMIKDEFTVNNSISRQARKAAIRGARECEVSYFAVGTLDVGLADTDPVTGNKRVFVNVKSQVWNINKRLPRKIAAVGPVQYQGLGPNARVAQNNALIQAAKNVANEISNQLNAKGLK